METTTIPANHWTVTCTEGCEHTDEASSFGKAISDAEWHNTVTGHNVSVVSDEFPSEQYGWDLTAAGWDPYDER